MDVFPKFIVVIDDVDGYCLLMAKVSFHKQLLSDNQKCLGGGWFNYDRESNTFFLHGESHDFGKASLENIKKCFEPDSGGVYTNRHMIRDMTDRHNYSYRNEAGEVTVIKQISA